MPIYELNIAFDEAGLNALAASGQKVTIVKQSRGGKLTAWINFSPLLANAISWSEQYSVLFFADQNPGRRAPYHKLGSGRDWRQQLHAELGGVFQ